MSSGVTVIRAPARFPCQGEFSGCDPNCGNSSERRKTPHPASRRLRKSCRARCGKPGDRCLEQISAIQMRVSKMTVAQLDVALDRPMPQSPDAERAVLGSILTNPNAFYRVIAT